MASFKLLLAALLLVFPTNWALSMTSSDSVSVSSKSPLSSNSHTKESPSSSSSAVVADTVAAATLGDLYRKSRQSRCVRCYDDRYADDYERTRYSTGRGGGAGGGGYSSYPSRTYDDRPSAGGGGYSSYPSRTYDDRPSAGGNWYYPRESSDRYDESRVGYGGGRENDRYYNYYYPYNGHYYERNEDRYNTRSYDRYERDRYDTRYSYERAPGETRGYGYGYDNRDRDRYYPSDRSVDRYPDRNRGSGGSYDRYGQDDRYYSKYDNRNYRPWDETYRGQSGFDNSGRGYYFANERPSDYYEPPPSYGPQSRPLGPGRPSPDRSGPSGPSTPGPTYLPHEHEQSRPSNYNHGYPDTRPGPSSSSSSSGPPASGSDYGNRPRDDVQSGGSGGGGGHGSGNNGRDDGNGAGSDNRNGYTGSSWSYVNDREKDASYKGGIRDKDNQSSPYGGGRGSSGRPLSGSYLLDRDNNNVPETSMAMNSDKPEGGDSQIGDSPMASKLTSTSSSTSKLNEDRVTESKDSK